MFCPVDGTGRRPATGGRIVWRSEPVSIRTERRAMELGIALSPDSRRDQGLCLNLGVGLNLNLPIFKRLSLGWDGSMRSWLHYETLYLLLAGLATDAYYQSASKY